MSRCRYFNDASRCQYCSTDDYDRIVWRSAHRVVGYPLYRIAIGISIAVGLFIGFVLGVKWR